MRSVAFVAAFALLLAACPDGNATPLSESEPNDLPAQAHDFGSATSGRITGRIDRTGAENALAAGDRDLVRLLPAGDGLLTATLTVPEGSDFDLAVFTADGRRLHTSRGADPVEILHARTVREVPILIEVAGYSGATGNYELSFTLDPRPDPADLPVPGPMAQARCFHGAAMLFGGGAIVGGGTRMAQNPQAAMLGGILTSEVFDAGTGKFSPGPSLLVSRFGVTATTLPDGRVLFAGGNLAGTGLLYDPGENALVGESMKLAGGMRALHTATLLPCGRVLLAGGAAVVPGLPPTSKDLATTDLFDPKTRSFTAGPKLRRSRFSHAASLLPDGRVLITGGERRKDSEILDLGAPDIESVKGPNLTAPRDDHTATVLADGRVLITGGQHRGKSVATAELLDDPGASADTEFHLLKALMSVPRSDHTATLLENGRVLILGGETDPGNGNDAILKEVDIFDPSDLSFRALPDLKAGRDDHRVVLLNDGRILVTGGEDEAGNAIPDVEAVLPLKID